MPEEILVPTFEIVSNPTVRLSEIMAKRFDIIDLEGLGALDRLRLEKVRSKTYRYHYPEIDGRFDLIDL